MSLADRIKAFLQQPFNPAGDAVNWALLVVFTVSIAIIWSDVVRKLKDT